MKTKKSTKAANPTSGADRKKTKAKESSVGSHYDNVTLKNIVGDKLTKINLAAAGLALALCFGNTAILIHASSKQSNNVYFQVDKDNRIVSLTPMNRPNQSVPSVASWLKEGLEETFYMNFYDYNERLSANSSLYFTKSGAEQLINALDSSRSLNNIKEKELFLTLTLNNPVFIREGVRNGVYTYHFQVRGQLSKNNVATVGKVGTQEKVKFDIYVERMDETERERGLGISRIVMDRDV